MTSISVSGLGFVGNAMHKSFLKKGLVEGKNLFCYDKYKNGGIGTFDSLLQSDIMFLALPTVYDSGTRSYDKSAIHSTLSALTEAQYKGLVVIKSTVEPLTCKELATVYSTLQLVHNPEFLTAVNAEQDYHEQKFILIGRTDNVTDTKVNSLVQFYKQHYSSAEIRVANSTETELMKIAENSFCAVKVQFFNELYQLSNAIGGDFESLRLLITKNNKITPNHTQVPGPDGQPSYGGYCFPKDTNALAQFMKRNNTPSGVLDACIAERNTMRLDHDNVK